MVYPHSDRYNLRTNDSFRSQLDRRHHRARSPLLRINDLAMIYQFPLDYMQLVCLGVIKKSISLWLDYSFTADDFKNVIVEFVCMLDVFRRKLIVRVDHFLK